MLFKRGVSGVRANQLAFPSKQVRRLATQRCCNALVTAWSLGDENHVNTNTHIQVLLTAEPLLAGARDQHTNVTRIVTRSKNVGSPFRIVVIPPVYTAQRRWGINRGSPAVRALLRTSRPGRGRHGGPAGSDRTLLSVFTVEYMWKLLMCKNNDRKHFAILNNIESHCFSMFRCSDLDRTIPKKEKRCFIV